MKAKSVVFVLLVCSVCLSVAKLQQPYNELQFNSVSKKSMGSIVQIKDDQSKQNEIDDRILISEPYKSLIQTTTRFALSNTKLSKHVDVVMRILNDAGYMLAKPFILVGLLKAVTLAFGTMMLGLFFLPGAPQFIESAWKNPTMAFGLKKYLPGGLHEKSVLKAINERTEELVSHIGLDNEICRRKTLCQAGELIKTSFPQKSKAALSFLKENFAYIQPPENAYLDAFASGIFDKKCHKISDDDTLPAEPPHCLSNFVGPFINTLGLRREFDE